MNILKYSQFNENHQDTPEEYIKNALMKIKKRVDSLFEEQVEEPYSKSEEGEGEEEGEEGDNILTLNQAIEKGKEKEKKNSSISLTDMGLRLESSELSNYSSTMDNVTFKFSDPESWYNLYVAIPLKSARPEDGESDFSDDDIKECSIKFKKYNDVDQIVGQLGPRTVKISDIDEDLIVKLKIELDDEYGSSEEEFEIET